MTFLLDLTLHSLVAGTSVSLTTRHRDRAAGVASVLSITGDNPVRRAQLLDSLQSARELKEAQSVLLKGNFTGESKVRIAAFVFSF